MMMNIGEKVTIRAKNPLWKQRTSYAFPIEKYVSYSGTVVPSPKWVPEGDICLSTGNPSFPFRVIERGALEALEKPDSSVYTIEGDKRSYTVMNSQALWSCSCTGFGYRRTCSHVVTAKSLYSKGIFSGVAKSLKSKQEKKLKKSEEKCCFKSKSAVQSNSRMMKRGDSPKDKEVTMVKVTKTAKVIEIMTKNSSRPMAEVSRIIETQLPCKEGYGKVWYRWAVKEGVALGVLETTAKVKVAKVKVAKTKEVSAKKLLKEVGIKTTKNVIEKSADEIAKIKEANLARLREVSEKTRKVVRRDYGDRVAKRDTSEGVADFDPQLAREEVNSILRDERLIEVCPKFVREDA
jgi:hypothetical protein